MQTGTGSVGRLAPGIEYRLVFGVRDRRRWLSAGARAERPVRTREIALHL